jgi:peroxidase
MYILSSLSYLLNISGEPDAGVGHDLVSLNIQRGRDHGIPKYNALRVSLGLSPVSSFADITIDAAVQQALSAAYNGDVNMVDAWIGGLAEPHVGGGMVGELFATIVRDQFTRLMIADPFFYLRDDDLQNNQPLLDRVIDVNHVELADILRWNTDLLTDHDERVMRLSSSS